MDPSRTTSPGSSPNPHRSLGPASGTASDTTSPPPTPNNPPQAGPQVGTQISSRQRVFSARQRRPPRSQAVEWGSDSGSASDHNSQPYKSRNPAFEGIDFDPSDASQHPQAYQESPPNEEHTYARTVRLGEVVGNVDKQFGAGSITYDCDLDLSQSEDDE
ncbi:hypothetical protein TWF694_008711 [Orbilia ellipsospora]|uniref:Uncharacterized protein n=1 Tax=Orbilia ellipsospora TaxID=2528407 RepID=A0AAV9XFY4_9PEZI